MTISQKVWFPIWNKDIKRDTQFLYWHDSLFLGALFLCPWSGECGNNRIVFVWTMVVSVIVVLGVRIPAHGGCTRLAIILVDMMVILAPAA